MRAEVNSAIFKRWLDVSGYSIFGLLGFPLGQLILSDTSWLGKALGSLFEPVHVPFIELAPAVALLGWIHWIIGFRFQHLSYTLRYPPLPMAVLGTILLAFVWTASHHPPAANAALGAALLSYALIVTAVGIARRFARHGAERRDLTTGKVQPTEPNSSEIAFEAILDWMAREEPTFDPDHDLFRLNSRTGRILKYLTDPKRKTVGIVGRFGCGKTTLANLVKGAAAASSGGPKLWFTAVSCWGLDSASAAPEAVLKQVVSCLAQRVDCFSLQGMPARYAGALSKASHYLDLILSFLGSTTPEAQLRKVTPLLEASDARLVVVVEDSDRTGSTFDVSHIEALLQRMRDVPGLCFVVTAGPDSKIDFARLCDHTEYIPELGDEAILTLVDRTRRFCSEKFPDDIDARPYRDFSGMKPDGKAALTAARGDWEIEMCRVIATPRNLKATLRRFLEAWEVLHGEVDMDELLIATCLRVCAPSVFSFLMRRHDQFHRAREGGSQQSDSLAHPIMSEWNELTGKDIDLRGVAQLLQVLCSASQVLFQVHPPQRIHSAQSFSSPQRSVYRERIFSEALQEGGISDQAVLRAIMNAKKNQPGGFDALAAAIEDGGLEYLKIFELFQPYTLPRGDDLWPLAKSLFQYLRKKHGKRASRDSSAFRVICVKISQHHPIWQDYIEPVLAEIELCIPGHLRLATDIDSFQFERLDQAKQAAVGDRVAALCKAAFQGKQPEVLAQSLDEFCPQTLRYLLIFVGTVRTAAPQLNPERWKWFGPTILDALRAFPATMAAQVAELIGASHSSPKLPSDYTMNDAILREIFQSQARDVVVELCKPFPVDPKAQHYTNQEDFTLVNARAERWLKDNP